MKAATMSYSKVQRLLAAVNEFERRHGKKAKKPWDEIRVTAKLEDYTGKQLSQKYANEVKKQKKLRPVVDTIGTDEQGVQVEDPEQVDLGEDEREQEAGQPEDQQARQEPEHEADEGQGFANPLGRAHEAQPDPDVLKIIDAAKRVHPKTVASKTFMKFLGYHKKSVAGQNSYGKFQKLMKQVIPHMPENWKKDLQELTCLTRNKRQENRDMELLRQNAEQNEEGNVDPNLDPCDVLGSVLAPTNAPHITGEPHVTAPRRADASEPVSAEDLITQLLQTSQPVTTSSTLATVVANATNACQTSAIDLQVDFSEPMSNQDLTASQAHQKPVEPSASTGATDTDCTLAYKRKPRVLGTKQYSTVTIDRFTNATHMPIPGGYDAMFPNRRLLDNEWRRIIQRARFHCFDFENAVLANWKNLVEEAEIKTNKSIEVLRLDFYRYAAPLMLELQTYRRPLPPYTLSLEYCNRFSCIVIYHSLEICTMKGLECCIRSLIEKMTLSEEKTDFRNWKLQFMDRVTTEKYDFFWADPKDFAQAKKSFIDDVAIMYNTML